MSRRNQQGAVPFGHESRTVPPFINITSLGSGTVGIGTTNIPTAGVSWETDFSNDGGVTWNFDDSGLDISTDFPLVGQSGPLERLTVTSGPNAGLLSNVISL
jgi:hypothetical protein